MCKDCDNKDWESKRRCGCQEGPQGVAGPQGQQGIQGIAGVQGAIGLTGLQGSQGIQGVPGKGSTDSAGGNCEVYANIYATVAQKVGFYGEKNDGVLFDAQNAVSAGDFDLTQAKLTGEIKVLKHAIYHLQWQLQARITPPIPSPVPSWSFGFFINGVLVPGSIYSGFTQAPGDDACHSNGDIIIEIFAGDKLKLRNTSTSSVNLNPSVTGNIFPITIASINIECLKALV